jgi:peptidyl-prolyl cis-trans isomerase SurA
MRTAFISVFTLFISSFPVLGNATDLSGDRVVKPVDRIVARVGSEPITQREVQTLQATRSDLTYSDALRSLVEHRLVLSWARTRGLTVSQEEVDRVEKSIMENNSLSEVRFDELLASRGHNRQTFRDEMMEQLIVNKALSTALGPKVRIEEHEIKQRYEEIYPPKKTFTIRHILLKPSVSEGEDETAAWEQAVRIADEIKGGASFENMALQHSMDPASAEKGGELGTFREGELVPELERAALDLEPGEVVGPVRTTMGFHILRLDGKGVTEPPPLASVHEEIRADLLSGKETEARVQWLKELMDSTLIEIFHDEE